MLCPGRAGNGINWKGQVFGRMRNWTANNRQTGVGNSLKKHYANFLWEYEQVGMWSGQGGRVGAGHVTGAHNDRGGVVPIPLRRVCSCLPTRAITRKYARLVLLAFDCV